MRFFFHGNVLSLQIECTGDVPPPRSGQSVCTYQDCVLLFGGMDSENEAIYNDLYSLNTGWKQGYSGECYVCDSGHYCKHICSVISSIPMFNVPKTLIMMLLFNRHLGVELCRGSRRNHYSSQFTLTSCDICSLFPLFLHYVDVRL